MKKIVFLPAFISFFLFCELSGAQVLRGKEASKYIPGAKTVRLDHNTGKAVFIKLGPGSKINKDGFQKWINEVLKLRSEEKLAPFHTTKDRLGFTHIKHKLYYQNITVEACIYIAHFDKNGNLSSCNGFYPAIASKKSTAAAMPAESVFCSIL